MAANKTSLFKLVLTVVAVTMLTTACRSVPDTFVDPAPLVIGNVLTVFVEGEGTVDPAGGTFQEATTLSLTASAADGYVFDHWAGDLTGQQNPVQLLVDRDVTVTAVFVPRPPNGTPTGDEAGIFPGISIGPIAVGDTVGAVDRALGAPDFVFPDPKYWAVHFVYEGLGLAGVLNDADRDRHADPFELVALVVAMESFSGTYQGVGIGSSRADVLAVMGTPEDIDGDDYWYPARGIVWTVKEGAVTTLGVFKPDPPDKAGTRSRTSSTDEFDETAQWFRSLRDELDGV